MGALFFDLIDACQLSCPSCHQGLKGGTGRSMSLGICAQIINHCRKHLGTRLSCPFNWGEPLLYGELPRALALLGAGSAAGMVCLSSNLNASLDETTTLAIVRNAQIFLISASGLDQESYSAYHQGGCLASVLDNIERLVAARDAIDSPISLEWVFGRHRFNEAQEEPIAHYCGQKRIRLRPTRYYLTDVEDVHRALKGEVVDRRAWEILYPTFDALVEDIQQRLTPGLCPFLEDVVMDTEGVLMTCCAGKITLGRHVTEVFSTPELIAAKQAHPFCSRCLELGLAGYFGN